MSQEISQAATKALIKIDTAADRATEKLAISAELASSAIAVAADKASSAIASALLDANKLVASQAASAAKVVDVAHGNDHDLIIKLDTKMDGLSDQIKKLDDNSTRRINTLEVEKLNCKDSYATIYKKDVDDRLDAIEARTWWIIVFLITSLLGVVYNLIK